MKKCFKCGRELPRSEFYRHKAMTDGLLGKCKACTRDDVRANREANGERYREYDRARHGPDRAARIMEARRTTHHEKHLARVAVRNALVRGKLSRKPCEVCGELKAQAHHDDYTQRLTVRWLCRKHHGEVHRMSA